MPQLWKLYTTYRDSHTGADKGRTYDEYYATNPYEIVEWSLEKQLLKQFVSTHFENRDVHLLDFACGTGRLTEFLEGFATTSVGVDLSEPMLDRAREKLKRTELVQADLTKNNVLKDRKFNLITAFRFFLHAEWPLRLAVIEVLADLLTDDGYLVFNNHRHRAAPWLIFAWSVSDRRFQQPRRYLMMSKQEMLRVANHAELCITQTLHLGVVCPPLVSILPESLTHRIESVAAKFRIFGPFSQNLIAVCQHRQQALLQRSAPVAHD